MKKPIWKCSTPEQKVILITLLLMVNHEAAEWVWQGRKFYIKPGQCITSASSIIKECGSGISRQNIRTALDKFEKYEFLTMQSTKTGMLITIVNWGLYQSMGEIQPRFQPRGNQEVTTNKKDNNKKKVCIDHFDNFWSAYPRKVSRAAAEKVFIKLKVDETLFQLMISSLENQKLSKQWQDKQFIPHPATWLNQKRWEDETDEICSTGIVQQSDGSFKLE